MLIYEWASVRTQRYDEFIQFLYNYNLIKLLFIDSQVNTETLLYTKKTK